MASRPPCRAARAGPRPDAAHLLVEVALGGGEIGDQVQIVGEACRRRSAGCPRALRNLDDGIGHLHDVARGDRVQRSGRGTGPPACCLAGSKPLKSVSSASARPLTAGLDALEGHGVRGPHLAADVGGRVAGAAGARRRARCVRRTPAAGPRKWPAACHPARGRCPPPRPDSNTTIVPAMNRWRRAPSIRATPISQENACILC